MPPFYLCLVGFTVLAVGPALCASQDAPSIEADDGNIKLSGADVVFALTNSTPSSVFGLLGRVGGLEAGADAQTEMIAALQANAAAANSTAAMDREALVALNSSLVLLTSDLSGEDTAIRRAVGMQVAASEARSKAETLRVETQLSQLVSALEGRHVSLENLTLQTANEQVPALSQALSVEVTRATQAEGVISQDVVALNTQVKAIVQCGAQGMAYDGSGCKAPAALGSLLTCSRMGLLWDSVAKVCRLPPPITDAQAPTCTTAEAGRIRLERGTGTVQFCDGSAFVPIYEEPLGKLGNPGKSCLDIYTLEPSTRSKNGNYYVQGQAGAETVYCDMVAGGWTLVLQMAAADSNVWKYDSSMWTSRTSTADVNQPDPSANKHYKSSLYGTLKFSAVRFHMSALSRSFTHTTTRNSPYDLFNPSSYVDSSASRGVMLNLVQESPSQWTNQLACNIDGYRQDLSGSSSRAWAGCRFGIIMNNEFNECTSSDSAIGFGCFTNADKTGSLYGRAIGCGGFRWNPTALYYKQGWVFFK